jgi:hypothetical protein
MRCPVVGVLGFEFHFCGEPANLYDLCAVPPTLLIFLW